MTLGLDLYQAEMDRLRAQRSAIYNVLQGNAGPHPGLANATAQQQQQMAQMAQMYGQSGFGGVTSSMTAPTKEEVYEKELRRLKKGTSRAVDVALGVAVTAVILVGAVIAVAGVRNTVIGTLSIVGVVGLYFGLHGAVFAYRKRRFDIEQATKAMLE